jgi:hypothetical protein
MSIINKTIIHYTTYKDNSLTCIDLKNSQNNNNENQISIIKSKLKSLGVYNLNKFDKIIEKLSGNQVNEFLNELEKLIDILSSKDLEKKLHPKVVKAVEESIVYDGNLGEVKEFKDLKNFVSKLLIDLLNSLADFNTITQAYKGTCAQTAVERSIAERNPEQYVKIITELITKGEYTSPNGRKIPLNSGGIRKTKHEQNDFRYLTTRIISPSFMEFYHNKDPIYDDYDEDKDKPYGSYSYLTAETIYNTTYNDIFLFLLSNFIKIEFLKDVIKSSKYPVFLGVKYQGIHAVELKNIESNSITISNPWGQIETYTIKGVYIDGYNFPTPIKNYNDFIKKTMGIEAPEKYIFELHLKLIKAIITTPLQYLFKKLKYYIT